MPRLDVSDTFYPRLWFARLFPILLIASMDDYCFLSMTYENGCVLGIDIPEQFKEGSRHNYDATLPRLCRSVNGLVVEPWESNHGREQYQLPAEPIRGLVAPKQRDSQWACERPSICGGVNQKACVCMPVLRRFCLVYPLHIRLIQCWSFHGRQRQE